MKHSMAHVLLLDLYMPGLDGFSVALKIRELETQRQKRLQQNEEFEKIHIIALSATSK
eukprot:Awhi_evm1s13471